MKKGHWVRDSAALHRSALPQCETAGGDARSASPHTRLTVAADITASSEFILTLPVAVWHSKPRPDLNKRPAIFIIGR